MAAEPFERHSGLTTADTEVGSHTRPRRHCSAYRVSGEQYGDCWGRTTPALRSLILALKTEQIPELPSAAAQPRRAVQRPAAGSVTPPAWCLQVMLTGRMIRQHISGPTASMFLFFFRPSFTFGRLCLWCGLPLGSDCRLPSTHLAGSVAAHRALYGVLGETWA